MRNESPRRRLEKQKAVRAWAWKCVNKGIMPQTVWPDKQTVMDQAMHFRNVPGIAVEVEIREIPRPRTSMKRRRGK